MRELAVLLAELLQLGFQLLERLDQTRAAAFRARVAADPAGMLIGKLGGQGGDSGHSGIAKPAKGGTGGDKGRVDE